MAYRGVKGSDPFVSKTSRNERFAQMSKQEQIIQQKKLEIQAKLEEQKAKEAVENLRKTTTTTMTTMTTTTTTTMTMTMTMTTTTTTTTTRLAPNSIGDKVDSTKNEEERQQAMSQTVNLFANDGSFLDQFKKIASNREAGRAEALFPLKSEEKEDTLEREWSRSNERNRDWDPRRTREDSRWERNSERRHCSPSQRPETGSSYTQVPLDGQHARQGHQPFHPPNGAMPMVPPITCQPMLRLTGVPPPSMRDIITSVPPPNLSGILPPKSIGTVYPGLDDRPADARMQLSPAHAIRPPPPPPPPPPLLCVQHIAANTSIPPPNMPGSRTAATNVQGLQPPPPPPPQPPPLPPSIPLESTSSASTFTSPSSSSSLFSSPPLLHLSSSGSSSSSSSSSRCSTSMSSPVNSTTHQIARSLGSASSSSTSASPSSASVSSSTVTSSLRPSSSLSPSSPSTPLPLPSLSSSTLKTGPVVPSTQQQHRLPPRQQCGVPPPAAPPTSLIPTNIPPPNMLAPMTQMPGNIMSFPTGQTIVVSVPSASNVGNVPPPHVMQSVMMTGPPPPVHNVASSINSVPPPNLNVPPPSLIQNAGPPPPPPPPLMSTSYPLPNQVGQIPMGPPNVQVPPPVRPLTDLRASEQLEAEQLARIVADCGDEIEQEAREKNAQDPKLWFLHQKQSAAYLQYRGLVAKLRVEKSMRENKNSGAEPYCPEEALSDNDDSEQTCAVSKQQLVPSQERKRERDRKREREGEHDCTDRPREDNKEERKRKRRSRWGDPDSKVSVTEMAANPPFVGRAKQHSSAIVPPSKVQQRSDAKNPMLTKVSRNDPALIQYARQTFGTLDLTEEQWKKAEDHYKINLLYQNLLRKREEVRRLEAQGKHKYEYDSDEETEGGTWEHKLRSAEMEATQMWAEELTAQAEGKHHIGDFLPPDELKKFMEQYNAIKQGKEPDLSDYKEYKLKEDNIGFQMLQKLGWSEGQGLGSEGNGRVDPINKANNRFDSAGLGSERPDGVSREDDEFDAYRKRMMLAYRFRPNPLNNPRRPYY